MASVNRRRIVFVCLGNICRSPLAEGIFIHLARERGVLERFEIDSAGTASYHVDERPDRRSISVAAANGVELPGTARQVTANDLIGSGLVVAMDRDNRRSLERLRPEASETRIVLMRDYDLEAPGADVPDPYYGGSEGFREVYDILERSCRALLDELTA